MTSGSHLGHTLTSWPLVQHFVSGIKKESREAYVAVSAAADVPTSPLPSSGDRGDGGHVTSVVQVMEFPVIADKLMRHEDSLHVCCVGT